MLTDIATTRPTARFMPRTPLQLTGRTVLLATDGSAPALAAANVARELASRHHATVHVVSVMDSRPAPIPAPLDLAVAIADASIGEAVHHEQVAAVRATLEAAVGEPVAWEVRVVLGTPAKAIVREARRLKASLIVVGLRRHGRVDRAMHDETTLEVIRHAPCPVLGVAQGAVGLPGKALAAVDFSLASLAATRAACAVLADGGAIVLAYVPPVTFDLPDDGEAVIHRLGVDAGFAQVRAELAGEGFATDSVVLHRADVRPMAELLLEYADGAKCDLIAAGSGRRGRVDRWMLGSVSTELVRDGRHSVLVTPPQQPARRVG